MILQPGRIVPGTNFEAVPGESDFGLLQYPCSSKVKAIGSLGWGGVITVDEDGDPMSAFPVRIEANLETGFITGRNKSSGRSADCELVAVNPGYAQTTDPEGLLPIVPNGKGASAGRIFKGNGSKVRIVG